MTENTTLFQENELPPAFVMWKMFHNTITAIFKNLNNAENNLQQLANTLLSSNECSDIFIPRYDNSLNLEQNKSVERTYQAFTTWLLGRLFYLSKYEKFERIHDLFIQAQQKILIVLQLNQPHIYNIIIKEYNDALSTVNKFLNLLLEQNLNYRKEFVVIQNFRTDNITFKNETLELTPIFTELHSQNCCFSLQPKILKIVTDASLIYTESSWLDFTSKNILDNILYCLYNSKIQSKVIVIKYFINLIKQSYFQIKKSPTLDKHFRELFMYLEAIVCGFNTNSSLEEFEILNLIISDLFYVILEYEIINDNVFALEKCKNMCQFLILYNLREYSSNKSKIIVKSSMKLLTSILSYESKIFTDTNFIISYITANKNCICVNILLNYQIFEELKNKMKDNALDALPASSTWNEIYNILNINLEECVSSRLNVSSLFETLFFMKTVMYSLQSIYCTMQEWYYKVNKNNISPFQIIFFPIEELLTKLQKVISMYNINTSSEKQDCLNCIVDSLACIISFTYFTSSETQNLKVMIEIICYPFWNVGGLNLSVGNLISEGFHEENCIEKQQLKAIDILSTCLLNVDSVQNPQIREIKTWIVTIFKFCVTSENSNILMQISRKIIYLIRSDVNIYELLKYLLKSKNLQVLKLLTESLGKIICVLSGKFILLPKVTDGRISYDIFCLQCDFTKNKQDKPIKLRRVLDNQMFAISQFIIQKNLLQIGDYSVIINLLECDDIFVKRNIAKQLPRFIKHINEFNSILVTSMWLKFIEDEDQNVRINFIQVIKPVVENCQNNSALTETYKKDMLDICLKTLTSIVQKHIRSTNSDLLETILDTIKEFGCLKYANVLYTVTKLITFYLILCNTSLSLTAIDHLNQIANSHGVTPNIIFNKYKKSICFSVATMSVVAYVGMEYNVAQSLERIALAFGFTVKEFLSRNGHHLLSRYVPCFVRAPASLQILTDIAYLMETDSATLIKKNFSYIYTYIYLNEDEGIFKNAMQLVEKTTSNNVNVLKKKNIKVIHNELLMHFYDKRELVLRELYKLSLEESDSNSGKSSSSKSSDKIQQISDYLQPRFLGVLVYFDSKLVSKSVDDSARTDVLKNLPIIIKLMGTKYITPLRHKVLATLRTALSLPEANYQELTCNSWEAFVRCCEVESLGPLLSTIFFSLLPLIELFPTKINNIFKYLIVENNLKLKNYIQDLFFLSETKVDNELKAVVINHMTVIFSKCYKEQLRYFLRYINHENLEVRVHSLKFLKKYLEGKQTELEELILDNNGMDSVLVEVIDVLIAGCRENDEQVRLACGQCIGELGAIEPSHFPRKYTTQSNSGFTFFITDDSFIVNVLKELLRIFQMLKDTQNMNRFALAIQEILKIYGISPDETAPKYHLWISFEQHLQELMLPLLSSKYTTSISQTVEKINPIFGSHIGLSFNDWIYNWTSHLISLLKNERRKLLQVCKPIFKYDYRTHMIFLPHIVIHALIDCSSEEQKLIFGEFMAILKFSAEEEELNNDQTINSEQCIIPTPVKKSDGSNKNNSIKVIFVLLDFIDRWLLEYEYQKCAKLSINPMTDLNYKAIHNFMSLFCSLQIAHCNFLWGEYPRALMYLEQHVSGDKNKLNDQLGFFTRIYAKLEEPDGVAGAMAMQETDPSVEDMTLAHNVSGRLQDAAACYERMAQERTLKPQYLQDMVRCYLELDNPVTALNFARGVIEKRSDCESMLYECQAESFWRLNLYDELADLLSKKEMKNNKSWSVKLGQALIHFRDGNRNDFQNEINNMQKTLISNLSITSLEEGVYTHGYPHIIKLHILNELQKAEEIIYKLKDLNDKTMCEKLINELVKEWNTRLKVVQSSVRVVEPILRIRRIILEQSQHVLGSEEEAIKVNIDKHISKYWLKSAEIARCSGIFQQAYIYILKAEQYKPMELFVEKAKLYWAKDDQDSAFSTLKRGIEVYFPDAVNFKDMDPLLRKTDRKLCAEAKLLIATYNDETCNVDMDVNITNYREAVDMCREWEKSQVCLAQYYDRVFSTMNNEEKDLKGGDIQIHIINSFGKSLQYGSTYIYQSMPRMLSIWFDYGTRIVQTRSTDSHEVKEVKKKTLFKMIKLMDTYLDRLPAYMFLSAFSQLVSRICHPVTEVYKQIKSILIKLILKYPQQSMWMIMAVSKSAYTMRTRRCQEVLQDERIRNSKILKLIYDFNRVAEKLIELCNKPIGDGIIKTSVSTLIRSLPRLLENKDFSEIMIPIQKLRKLILPNSEHYNSQHNPFPNNLVYIVGIEDEVQILQSLQRPRKIAFRGSDGNKYIHMLKPKDDLRKDYRLMEFNDVVNLYLHRESESRQRRLCIRTYSVVPLNEECGLIEWVDNLVGLRPILITIYKQKSIYTTARELKSLMCNIRDPPVKKREIFEKEFITRHPPVLSEWFRRTFPDAHCWYHARTAYVRTSAVMSMVGYILGLGDRHGENILFDSTNGDIVHVDFNCLFNKGETFDWPERVPFRLTHNMTEAMGPLGVEGIFRRTCALTLRVLRTHTNTLMSIVRPFVYDPLVSWPRNQLLKSDIPEAERTNEQAVEHIRNIELRLQGMSKTRGKSFSISLSCEGQANNLIQEATSIDNLSQMYIGWGPYL